MKYKIFAVAGIAAMSIGFLLPLTAVKSLAGRERSENFNRFYALENRLNKGYDLGYSENERAAFQTERDQIMSKPEIREEVRMRGSERLHALGMMLGGQCLFMGGGISCLYSVINYKRQRRNGLPLGAGAN